MDNFRKKTGLSYFVVWVVLMFYMLVGVSYGFEFSMQKLQEQVCAVTEKVTPATVALVAKRGETGSGVIVRSEGLVLTAAHVVQGNDTMLVILPDGRQVQGRVLGANFTRDVAMVQITEGGDYAHVELGDSDALKVGDFVVALGHSKGFDPERRAPVRLGRMCSGGKQRFLITECTLIGGDSGGPLFNLDGELVGIHSSIGPHLKINNHAPISIIQKDWEKLVAGQQFGQLGLHPMADPETPVMGFSMMDVYGVEGVVVEDVVVGSPADKAGIRPGDVIRKLDNHRLLSTRDMLRELGRFRPNETVLLEVQRRGVSYHAKLTFARRGDILSNPKK